jgi:hypothetical protein
MMKDDEVLLRGKGIKALTPGSARAQARLRHVDLLRRYGPDKIKTPVKMEVNSGRQLSLWGDGE